MIQKKDSILSREIGKLGGFGARLVAGLLPKNVFELTIETHSPPETALEKAFTILNTEGKVIEDRRNAPNKPALCAVMGAGIGNLNPALVEIYIMSNTDNITKLLIVGTAKEGLIKQYAGEKAARKIADQLTQVLP